MMVNFNLGNQMIKMKCPFVTSMGQRKNLSPQQETNPWPPRDQLGTLTTELQETLGELGNLLSSYVTRLLHTARISNMDLFV